ncbi:hypothetical protein [Streptomyces ehimensis]|uniref:Uncharacterized protein n=1 Tax=Streptomyces ehimensis TaxID=68195 RepID=A0ABV9BW52_9ACTN
MSPFASLDDEADAVRLELPAPRFTHNPSHVLGSRVRTRGKELVPDGRTFGFGEEPDQEFRLCTLTVDAHLLDQSLGQSTGHVLRDGLKEPHHEVAEYRVC